MNAAMISAFNAASGGTAGAVSIAIALALAASVFAWGANAVRMLLLELMQDPRCFVRNGWLVMRTLMIVMLFVYLLV